MRTIANILVILSLSCASVVGSTNGATEADYSSVTFNGVEYLHRWSNVDQHEFTPREQEDLERWSDMVTINHYRNVTDGEGLAAAANAVLERYKSNRARVVRTDSVPRTDEKPAEYLIVVLFPQPTFIEAVFARFKIVGGVGTSAIYSHRVYGEKIGDEMSAWLKSNGPSTEKALMSWEGIPEAKAQKS